jgi:pimeloyl-ACP methyl ester carboxylesterase
MSHRQSTLRVNDVQGMLADISAATSRIAVPVHIIAGGDDAVEPEISLRSAFGKVLRRVEFTVIPGVGHIAPLEAPAALAQAIRSAQAG